MVSKKQTVILNGKAYDVATGELLADQPAAPKPAVISDIAPVKRSSSQPKKIVAPARKTVEPIQRKARSIAPHARQTPQKSTTLRRSATKKPASQAKQPTHIARRKVQRSEAITKFAPAKVEKKPISKPNIDKDLLAQTKALEQAQAEHIALQQQRTTPVTTRAIKEHLLHQAIEKVPAETVSYHKTHGMPHRRRSRFTSATMASFALILLGGYLTFINIPNLSIRVAAASSGVNATLPSYQPAGYRIHGPISYQTGEVNVKYQQNGSNLGYKLTQRPTDWDPIATLDNYVENDSKNDYQIHSVQGLTVYTYAKKAVWVNGGILHIIAGNAPLSSQQVERIVASM